MQFRPQVGGPLPLWLHLSLAGVVGYGNTFRLRLLAFPRRPLLEGPAVAHEVVGEARAPDGREGGSGLGRGAVPGGGHGAARGASVGALGRIRLAAGDAGRREDMRLNFGLAFYPVGGLRGVRGRLPVERAVEAASAVGGPGRMVGAALVPRRRRAPLAVLVVGEGALARSHLTRGAVVGVGAGRARALQAGELRGRGPAALWPQSGVGEGGICGRHGL